MPVARLDGIDTYYEIIGDGEPLLMFSPGGFNAMAANWHGLGVYRAIKPVEHLSRHYACIVFDRREAGESGGRVERITWDDYVNQGLALLDHLGSDDAHLMGGCVGCSQAAAFAVGHPDRARSMILYSPAGGPRYRMTSQARFWSHLAFVKAEGLPAVVELARSTDEGFSREPRVGPWVAVIRSDTAFAQEYADLDVEAYTTLVTGMLRTMFDRDTVPGVEPEDLMRLDIPTLIVPGEDASHATSAARYLQECIPGARYWDVPVAQQTAEATAEQLTAFLAGIG